MALREKLNEMMDMMPSRKAAREASAEMKRESRGIPKPYNFDAIQEAKQDAMTLMPARRLATWDIKKVVQ